jgi:hypothetical protein
MMSKSFTNCLNDITDISFLLRTVEQISPQSILDIGMFLKRVGCISRHALDDEIDPNCILDGVDCMPDIQVPVYDVIYDHIMSLEDFLSQTTVSGYQPFAVRKYDLAAVIQPGGIIPPQNLAAMWEWISLNSRYAATNYFSRVYESIPNIRWHEEFESGGNSFSIIIFR